jgi:hypothetical protein
MLLLVLHFLLQRERQLREWSSLTGQALIRCAFVATALASEMAALDATEAADVVEIAAMAVDENGTTPAWISSPISLSHPLRRPSSFLQRRKARLSSSQVLSPRNSRQYPVRL